MNQNQLTWPVFSLLMSRRGVERGALGEGGLSDEELSWLPQPPAPPRPQPLTYLPMRDAKGCTCSEVPTMMRRSTFGKSYEGGVAIRAPGPPVRLGSDPCPPLPAHPKLVGEVTFSGTEHGLSAGRGGDTY